MTETELFYDVETPDGYAVRADRPRGWSHVTWCTSRDHARAVATALNEQRKN